MTIGALETVLAETQEGEMDIEERILEILLQSGSREETRRELDALGDEIAQGLQRQRAAESLTVGILEGQG